MRKVRNGAQATRQEVRNAKRESKLYAPKVQNAKLVQVYQTWTAKCETCEMACGRDRRKICEMRKRTIFYLLSTPDFPGLPADSRNMKGAKRSASGDDR